MMTQINFLRVLLVFVLLFLINEISVFAQSTTDGFMMAKGNLCLVGDYSHESWKNYWEGTKKKESHYVGTFNSESVNVMFGLGIVDNLLFTGSLPYIWTSSTEFYNSGQNGFQDLSIGLKWKSIEKHIPRGDISFQPSVSGTIPISDYIPDMMPYSIGNQSKTFSGNALVHYAMEKNFYVTLQWGYVYRDNITIDATSYYYNEKLYYTNEVFIPNLIQYGACFGYDVERFRAEGWFTVQNSQGGSDIRPNDKPYPFNRMSFTKAGLAGKYHFEKISNLSLTASVGYTFDGRNIGQSFSYLAGIQYILKCF